MYYFDNFTQPALMYLMLHSVYCWCWLTKVRVEGSLRVSYCLACTRQ